MGLVSQVFDESTLESLKGHLAVGHARYSTTGASTWDNAQPTFRPTADRLDRAGPQRQPDQHPRAAAAGRGAGRAHRRARLPRPQTLETTHQRHQPGHRAARRTTPTRSLEESAVEVLPAAARRVLASSGWTRTRCTPPATRRASGRWCSAGSSAAGWSPRRPRRSTSSVPRSSARSSPASWSRSTRTGCAAAGSPRPAPKGCLFEFVYLARPDTLITGQRVHSVRVEIGRRLAREFPADADLVIPVPESGTPAAIGYAEEQRHPLRHRPGEELLRRPHLHPALADDPAARHPAQAQPAARRDRGQAAGRRRRLDRARQHPARPGPDAARGRRPRGARADLRRRR